MRKVIFLDIDGVLNSYRTCHAYEGYPQSDGITDKFDDVALGLIRKACRKCNAEIVLSSSWRLFKGWDKLKDLLDLPIVDRTPKKMSSTRGEEISMWLRDNVVFEYVIVDDDSDMLENQKENFVHTDYKNGLSYEDYEKILKILGVENE